MDHTDIRGLATAFHRYVAGLPRARGGDHPDWGCPHSRFEDSPHRVPRIALPIPGGGCAVKISVSTSWRCFSNFSCSCEGSRASGDVLTDIPHKARQLACERHTDLVVLQPTSLQSAIPMSQPQLRMPSNGADLRGLLFLTLLQRWCDARWEAVVPSRLN